MRRLEGRGRGTVASEGAEDLAHLVDRLGARLGLRRVTRLVEQDTHVPEFAVMAVSAASASRPPLPAACGERVGVRGGTSLQTLALRQSPALAPPLTLSPSSDGERGQRAPRSPHRPIRLLASPERIEALAGVPDGPPLRFRWRRVLHDVRAVEGPERIAPEWWRREGDALTRDYFRAEDSRGRRFWIFREGLYGRETQETRWFMHGLFA